MRRMPEGTLADELYWMYPKHVGSRVAVRAIEKALKRLPLELKLAGVEVGDITEWMKERVSAFAASPAGQRGQMTPYPATWFNQSRYLDDQDVWHQMSPKEEENMRLYAERNVGVWRP